MAAAAVVVMTVLVLIYWIRTGSLVALLMMDMHSLMTALGRGYHHFLRFVCGPRT